MGDRKQRPAKSGGKVGPQAIIDTLPFQMAILDENGIIRQVNASWKAFARDNGGSIETINGVGLDYLRICEGAGTRSGRKVCKGIASVLAGSTNGFRSEYPCHSETVKRWFIMEVSALEAPWKGALVSHFRITERVLAERARKKLEVELVAARDAAVASERSKAEFLSQMSHEIRTPLNGIIGLLETLKDETLAPGPRSTVETLDRLADHLIGIVNDVLDLAKLEAGKLTLEHKPFDPGRVAEDVVGILRRLAEDKGLRLSCRRDPGLPGRVVGDARRLRQILLNLTANALKFTDAGSVTISVRAFSADTGRTRLEFTVRDTGVGISPEALAKLFKRFAQVEGEAGRSVGGTGLGLAISRHLAEMMGGSVAAESVKGRGSAFTASILAGTAVDEEPESWTAVAAKDPLIHAGHGAILVADDNEVNRKIMSAALAKLGWPVLTAENGQQALDLIARGGVAALLLDCQMPVLDGYATAQAIRRRESGGTSRLPIIAITADVMEANLNRCRDCGMDAFLPKPFRREDIARLVDMHPSRPAGRAA